ncbi:MAG: hypothetical protein WA900_14375 [Casimicrobiaceae bacterium]
MNSSIKIAAIACGVLLCGGVQVANASCTSGDLIKSNGPAPNIGSVLTGNTVCATLGSDKWQEYHQTGGNLYDYKKGPSDPVDPTTQVGTWGISGNGSNSVISYTYGSTTYTYSFCGLPAGGPYTSYNFQPNTTGSLVTGATVHAGQVGC